MSQSRCENGCNVYYGHTDKCIGLEDGYLHGLQAALAAMEALKADYDRWDDSDPLSSAMDSIQTLIDKRESEAKKDHEG